MKAKLVQVPQSTVDTFGDLAAAREAFAPQERAYQKLRSEIAAMVAEADPEAEFEATGERYAVKISARGFETKADVPAVRKKLGAATFLECVTVSLKSLANYLTKPEIDEVTVTGQTGSRKIESVPLKDV
jgi:murein L,D-transpeptidase YcbB/YkuD